MLKLGVCSTGPSEVILVLVFGAETSGSAVLLTSELVDVASLAVHGEVSQLHTRHVVFCELDLVLGFIRVLDNRLSEGRTSFFVEEGKGGILE